MQVCIAVLLLTAVADWPYGYYQFLRLATCAVASVLAWRRPKMEHQLWVVVMAGVALLFNPVIPVRFHRMEWVWIDVATAVLFLVCPR